MLQCGTFELIKNFIFLVFFLSIIKQMKILNMKVIFESIINYFSLKKLK